MPRRSIRSASASFDITPLLRLNFWNVFSSVAKNACHPDQFIQEFVEAPHITLIEPISLLIEKILHVSKIHVPKDCYQAKLAHDRQQTLNHTRAAKQTRRDSAHPHRTANELLKIHVERLLHKAGVTMF